MNSTITKLALIGLAATSCGKLTIQVKKDSKSGSLQGAESKSAAKDSFSLANPQDFLKHVDDLRTTAAEIIVKKLASEDYVGKFRAGVRNYRKFLIAHARKPVTLSDNFYADANKQCRDGGLDLNIDSDNEILGLILETAIIAKIGETNVGKLNAGLTKEMQALSQFITMELGVDIQGTSSVDKEGDINVTKGEVKIKLKPIADEKIDDATKAADEVQVLTLSFERRLGADMVGTFHANLSLPDLDESIATADFDISRSKDTDHYEHVATVTMGMKGQAPNYARQITVSDIPGDSKKFKFIDVLNVGSKSEVAYSTIVDTTEGTQCKVTADGKDSDGKDTDGKDGGGGSDIKDPPSNGGSSGGNGSGGSKDGGGSNNPGQSPTQSPTQNPAQTPVKK